MSVTAAFHRARKEKETWEVVESQAPLLADKATLAGETTDDLLAIETGNTRRSVIFIEQRTIYS
ncbi:hypothetical protein V3C40_27865 [Janthinobacterium sp. LS2A]|uniref:hypothetical protein n=1 Tax=Janthinobacterium sp. LS2A TaxID=3118590 RepID=UPI002F94D546